MSTSIPIPKNPRFQDLTNKVFNRYTVVRYSGINSNGHSSWFCVCQCGNFSTVSGPSLKNGHSKSCGCLKIELFRQRLTKHGMRHIPEYKNWQMMKRRCNNSSDKRYERYGGRGIKVCDRWQSSFANFFADIGPRPSPKHSIDRINNDGNYEPSNCRWATNREQSVNRISNIRAEWNGINLTATEWARKYNFDPQLIIDRLNRGWSIEKALTTPLDDRRGRTRRMRKKGQLNRLYKLIRTLALKDFLPGLPSAIQHDKTQPATPRPC